MNHQNKKCPCGSESSLDGCCGPLLAGDQNASTAEQLMRSRYTAFVVDDEKYLHRTWHPSMREKESQHESTKIIWQGLEIVKTEEGMNGDKSGTVEFIARFTANNRAGQVHEKSRFIFEKDRWYYLDGEDQKTIPTTKTAIKKPKVGRNEPCPCGSGKKYKRCCYGV
jgi:SEC-C motif-containing protein